MYSGPHIKRDGLVFGYDTGRNPSSDFDHKVYSRRHFKGKPVTNKVNYGSDFSSWTTARNSGSYPTIDSKVAKGPFKGTKADRLSLPSDGSYPRIYQSFTPTTTSTHTFSVWLKGETAGQGCFVGCFRNSPWALPSSTNFSITTEWQHYTFAVNPADITSHQIYIGSHNNHGGKVFLMYGAQLEVGTVASPFNVSSRSSTQSLIDLTKTTNIDVSNVSFDSDGLPTFDGTDDIITFNPGTFPSSWSQPFSVEAIVYIPSSAIWYKQGSGTGIIGRGSYTGSWGLFRGGTDNSVYFYLRTGGTTFNPGGIIGRDSYYHIVGTWDGISQAIFYINGSQNSQETSTNVGTTVGNTGDIRVGGNVAFGGSNGGYGEGTYPVIKIYNRALSAQEIKQNFKAYKNRFNL